LRANLNNTLGTEIFIAQDIPHLRAWDGYWILAFPATSFRGKANDVSNDVTISFVFIRWRPRYIHSGISQEFK
jgi:hypothetical protein